MLVIFGCEPYEVRVCVHTRACMCLNKRIVHLIIYHELSLMLLFSVLVVVIDTHYTQTENNGYYGYDE